MILWMFCNVCFFLYENLGEVEHGEMGWERERRIMREGKRREGNKETGRGGDKGK